MLMRRTFVVHVHEPDGSAVLENVRTGEHARVKKLSEIEPKLAAWLKGDNQPSALPPLSDSARSRRRAS